MNKFSGLVLDVADDVDGEVLKAIYPCRERIPPLVKSAEFLGPDRRNELPDDLFAIVLRNGPDGVSLRKYACTDAGNTELSVQYFLKTAHKLPVEAQKLAANNLVTACGWYDLEVPEELRKVAIGLAHAATLVANGMGAAQNTKKSIGENLAVARNSGGMVNPNVIKSVVT